MTWSLIIKWIFTWSYETLRNCCWKFQSWIQSISIFYGWGFTTLDFQLFDTSTFWENFTILEAILLRIVFVSDTCHNPRLLWDVLHWHKSRLEWVLAKKLMMVSLHRIGLPHRIERFYGNNNDWITHSTNYYAYYAT